MNIFMSRGQNQPDEIGQKAKKLKYKRHVACCWLSKRMVTHQKVSGHY